MYDILIQGIKIFKHGRSGRPKERYLFCDIDMTILYWRANRSSSTSPDISITIDDDNDIKQKKRRSTFFNKQDADRVLYFRNIIQISRNIETNVMKRAYNKNYLNTLQENSQIISIVVNNRSLDFEVQDVSRRLNICYYINLFNCYHTCI